MSDNAIILLRGAKVFAPEDMGSPDILLGGGHVIAMGEKLIPNIPGMETIDATGFLAIPGLFDQHVHVTGGGGESGFSSRVPELSAEDLLSCGVTSTVGLLGTDSVTRSVHSLVAKTKALREVGMSAWCLTGAYDLPSPTLTGSVKDDVAFIDEIIGVKVAINDHRCAMPTQEELTRLAAHVRLAALTAGKPGVVHIHVGRGNSGLSMLFRILEDSDLPISHFRPTHVENVLGDAIRFGKLGGRLDFTADEDASLTASQILEAVDVPWEQLSLSSDAGGSIPVWNEKKEMVGMDVGHPDTLLPVVRELWQNHGLTLSRALCLITCNPADGLGLHHKGRIAPGADADILLTDTDLNPRAVFAGGRLLWGNV